MTFELKSFNETGSYIEQQLAVLDAVPDYDNSKQPEDQPEWARLEEALGELSKGPVNEDGSTRTDLEVGEPQMVINPTWVVSAPILLYLLTIRWPKLNP